MVLEGAGHRVIDAAGSPQANALLSNGLNPISYCVKSPRSILQTERNTAQFLQYTAAQNICLIMRASEQSCAVRHLAWASGIS